MCAGSKTSGVDIRDPDGAYRLFDQKLCRNFAVDVVVRVEFIIGNDTKKRYN